MTSARADRKQPVYPNMAGAASVLWLCSSAASFAVGTILPIDGGYMA